MAIRRKRILWFCIVAIGFSSLTFFLVSNYDPELQISDEDIRRLQRRWEARTSEKRVSSNSRLSILAASSKSHSKQQQHLLQPQQHVATQDIDGGGGNEGGGVAHYEDLHQFLYQVQDDWHFWWIRKRIQLLWPEFEAAGKKLNNGCLSLKGPRRQVMILPGVLTLTNFARPEVIRNGGSLGELVQLADLIAGCYALCHKVLIRIQFSSTAIQLRADATDDDSKAETGSVKRGCAGSSLDFIFTDIGGFRSLPTDVIDAYRHKFRIADAFGTEAEYNDPEYAKSHGTAINHWGMLDLRLKQFFTLYPHTPDNSFLGFVVSKFKFISDAAKENYGLIMGKEITYLKGKMKFLQTIHEIFPLRATMSSRAESLLPPGAQTLGNLDSSTFQELLRAAKVCVGLGDPVESPGALEAIAQGCVFLNPRRKGASMTLTGKPNRRPITSQVPYLEEYVGPPYVYTIDEDDQNELRRILRIIVREKNRSILPYEFSVEGYLQRLGAYLAHQDYCQDNHSSLVNLDSIWPPITALRVEVAPTKTSCKKACSDRGLVCEPVYFPILNSLEYFLNITHFKCKNVQYDAEIYSPAYFDATEACSFQQRRQLFSCASGEREDARRICPCRDYQPFQIALCKECT